MSISKVVEDSPILDSPWTLDDFTIGKPLGKGRFGRVYLARENRTHYQHHIALKILFKNTLIKTETKENFKRECELHERLLHPNVLRMLGWFDDDRRIFIMLEFAINGNLFKKIENGPLSDFEAATYIYQTAKGLMYIHSMNIVHRDLKPENILLGCFNEIKIADFGWSNRLNNEITDCENICLSVAGTLDYLCPEVIARTGHSSKVDNWCLGVLTYEILVGQPPFHTPDIDSTVQNILHIKYKAPSFIKKSAQRFISKLLMKAPSKRMELSAAIEDDWIQQYADKDESYMKYFVY